MSDTKMYFVVCWETGEEDAIEAYSAKEAIDQFAVDKNIDKWDNEATYNSITATVLLV